MRQQAGLGILHPWWSYRMPREGMGAFRKPEGKEVQMGVLLPFTLCRGASQGLFILHVAKQKRTLSARLAPGSQI